MTQNLPDLILTGLKSSQWNERGNAARLLMSDLDNETLINVLVGSDSLIGTQKRLIVDSILPRLNRTDARITAFCLYHIFTRILNQLRDERLEWDAIQTLFSNRRITAGMRSRILCEALRAVHVPGQKQRRFTRRLLLALRSCPSDEARELAIGLLASSEVNFQQELVTFICSYKKDIAEMFRYFQSINLNDETKTIVFNHLIGFDENFSYLKLAALSKIYINIVDKELFVTQLLSVPKKNTGSLALRLYESEPDPRIQKKLAIAIAIETKYANLIKWWKHSSKLKQFKEIVAMRARIAQSMVRTMGNKINASQVLDNENFNLGHCVRRVHDPFKLTNLIWDAARLLENIDYQSLRHVIVAIRPEFPTHALPVLDQLLFRTLSHRSGALFVFFQVVTDCGLTLEFRQTGQRLLSLLRSRDIQAKWSDWSAVLLKCYAAIISDANSKALAAQINKVLVGCFEHATKIINVRNQNLPKHSELDCFVQLALHLGRAISSEIFVVYLQGGQNQTTAADYLSMRSEDELLSIFAGIDATHDSLLRNVIRRSFAPHLRDSTATGWT
jgi:hypothetical protein